MNTHRAGWLGLFLFMLVYAVLFVWMYPPLSGIEDEVGFVNQALVWSRGTISSEAAGYAEVTDFGQPGVRPHLIDFVLVGSRHLPGRHPGRSLFLLPFFLLGGIRAGFLSGLLIHLATTVIGALLLRRLGRSPIWAILILFHPTLALYSRTIMGDEAAGGFLLVAALLATVPGRRGAIAAGLAVGLAALMRYHAGLALPIIAISITLDSSRDNPRRDGLACLGAGGICGLLLVVYNISLYHAFLDPVGGPRGQFGLRFIPENLLFYGVALMAVWPGMLAAPVLDRSAIGGIARGISGIFLVFFSAYYFHDRGGNFTETWVLGLRLMQVALPIWITSYATLLAHRLSLRTALVIGIVLVGGTGVAFHKHQRHLHALKAARDAIIAEVPSGSVIVTHGASYKLFGIPAGGPIYRWLMLISGDVIFDHSAVIGQLGDPWYLAILVKGDSALPEAAVRLIDRYQMRRIESSPPGLILYCSDPPIRVRP